MGCGCRSYAASIGTIRCLWRFDRKTGGNFGFTDGLGAATIEDRAERKATILSAYLRAILCATNRASSGQLSASSKLSWHREFESAPLQQSVSCEPHFPLTSALGAFDVAWSHTCGEFSRLRIARLRFHWLSLFGTAMSRAFHQSKFPNCAGVVV
jgi:hypothetical protein